MNSNLQKTLLAALIATALPGAHATADAPSIDWHAPATPEEHALDAILKSADRDDDQLDNLLGGRGPGKFRQTFDYRAVLTQRLISAIRRTETKLVKRNCGGNYYDGEICGLDFLPIECTQDTNDTYLYRTDMQNKSVARIDYAWPSNKWSNTSLVASYKLVKIADQWKIDGIKCCNSRTFNMQ